EAADVAGDDAARGEEKTRRRDDAAPVRAGRVVGIAPERVVVSDAVGIVADVVARRLVAPRFERIGDLDADSPAQVVEPLLGDLREERCLTGHASSPRLPPPIREAPCG